MINIRFGFDHTDMYMGVSWGLDYMAHVFRECPVTGETQRAEAHAPNPTILAYAAPYGPGVPDFDDANLHHPVFPRHGSHGHRPRS